MAGDIADVNPVAIASDWLSADAELLALFQQHYPGAQLLEVPILGTVRPPYPMLRIAKSGGGSLNDMRWRISPEVVVEAWGDTDGRPGPDALERICTKAVLRLKALEDKDYAPWEPVVTHVQSAVPFPLDDPSGQARWLAPVTMTCHPALAPELLPPAGQVQGG